MTLADELHHALAVDAEPDLPAIRARVQRRQRRLHWAQGAAVAGLLAVVVGALVAIPRPGTVAFDNPGQSPVAPFAPSHESVGIEEVVILQVGSTVEVEAWIANHGDQAVTVVDLTLQAWDGSTWVPLPSPTPVVPTVVPGITRGIVQTTMRAESPLAEGWYAVVVGLEDRDLSLVVRRDGQQVQQAAVLPGVEGSSAYRGVALVPAPLGIAVTGSGEADVSLGPVTIARWDGAGWRDIPPAAGRAAALPPGLLLVPFDPASWQLHVGDPWMSSSAGTPPGWYRVTLGVTFPDGEQQALAVVTHRPWPVASDATASPEPTVVSTPCEVAILGDATTHIVAADDTLTTIAEQYYPGPAHDHGQAAGDRRRGAALRGRPPRGPPGPLPAARSEGCGRHAAGPAGPAGRPGRRRPGGRGAGRAPRLRPLVRQRRAGLPPGARLRRGLRAPARRLAGGEPGPAGPAARRSRAGDGGLPGRPGGVVGHAPQDEHPLGRAHRRDARRCCAAT